MWEKINFYYFETLCHLKPNVILTNNIFTYFSGCAIFLFVFVVVVVALFSSFSSFLFFVSNSVL